MPRKGDRVQVERREPVEARHRRCLGLDTVPQRRGAVTDELEQGKDDLLPEAREPQGDDLARPSVALPPGAAQGLRDFARLTPHVKGTVKGVAGNADPWTVTLSPSKETREAFRAGKVALTQKRQSGELLAQVRDVKSGQVVENVPMQRGAEAAKGATAAKAATAGAAVAWQALAIATQQHYLVEISGRLSSIEHGVGDLVQRDLGDKASALETTEDDLRLVEKHIVEGHALSETERQDLREAYKEARRICDAQSDQAWAIVNNPERDSATALSDLRVADRAAQVAARCAAALLRMPPESPEKHLAQFQHYFDVTEELLTKVDSLYVRLLEEQNEAARARRRYLATRPSLRRKEVWNAGPGRSQRLHWGPPKPRFDGLRTLPEREKHFLFERVKLTRERAVEATPATVLVEGNEARLVIEAETKTPTHADSGT
jgi:hypothetical protein